MNVPDSKMFKTLTFVSLGFLFLYVLLGFWALPFADDFCYANSLSQVNYSIFEMIVSAYKGWTGRYSSVFFITLPELAGLTIENNYILASITIFVLFSCWGILGNLLLKPWVSDLKTRAGILVLAGFAILGKIPRMSSFFYWFNGVANYIPALICCLILFFMLNRWRKFRLFSGEFFGAAVLVLINSGTNLLPLFIANFALLMVFLYALKERQYPQAKALFCLGLISLVGSLILVLAPGNYARMKILGEISGETSNFKIIYLIWKMFSNYVIKFISFPLLALFILINLKSTKKTKEILEDFFKKISPLFYFSLVVLCLLFCCIIFAFIIKGTPPYRAQNLMYVLYNVALIPVWLQVALSLVEKFELIKKNPISPKILSISKILLVIIFFAGSSTHVRTLKELFSGKIFSYHNYHRRLYKKLGENPIDSDMTVPPPPPRDRTVGFHSITPDAKHWRNGCIAQYYKIKSLKYNKR